MAGAKLWEGGCLITQLKVSEAICLETALFSDTDTVTNGDVPTGVNFFYIGTTSQISSPISALSPNN
jgi:hypothetical protein